MSGAEAATIEIREPPVAQAVGIAFLALRVLTVLLACGWAAGNIRQVPPDTQAAVLRFGRIVRVQQAGLVLALPRPLESVALLPGRQKQLTLPIHAGTARVRGIIDPAMDMDDVPDSAGLFLTGDDGVLLLQATLTYHVTDAAAYYVAESHVPAALRRLYLRAATGLAAGRVLDDFMAVRPEHADDPAIQAARNALRGDLVDAINRQLAALDQEGSPLGVEVTRADLTALLPPDARSSFNAVLEAGQRMEQTMAAARTDALHLTQQAEQDRDRLIAGAHAAADERLSRVRAELAQITALEDRTLAGASRPAMFTKLYRDRMARLLGQALSVITVDPATVGRLILPAQQ